MTSSLHRVLMVAAALVATGAVIAARPALASPVENAASPAAPQPPNAPLSGAAANPVGGIPLAELAVTRDRPIFSPARRPPPPPPPVAAPIYTARPVKVEPERPPLILVGTIVGAGKAIAVFVEKTTRNVVRLHPSENHDGWILRSVQGREVTLQKADDEATVLALAPPGSVDLANAQVTAAVATRPPRP